MIRICRNTTKSNNAVTIAIPTSKSYSNRFLIITQVASATVSNLSISGLSEANDTVVLQRLLAKYNTNKDSVFDCEDAGTVFRFLMAYFAMSTRQTLVLTGTKRLLQRPITPLVDALCSLGAVIDAVPDGFIIHKKKTVQYPKKISVDGKNSSQFLSALLLIAPLLTAGLQLETQADPVSESYINMTLQAMSAAGVDVIVRDNCYTIPPQPYHLNHFEVETDWSGAAYVYGWVLAGLVDSAFIPELNINSLQGDAAIRQYAETLGVLTIEKENGCSIERNYQIQAPATTTFTLKNAPDLGPLVFVMAALANCNAIFTHCHHLALKESNRIEAMQEALAQLHISLTYTVENGEILIARQLNEVTKINPTSININTKKDHRIAMACSSLVALAAVVAIDEEHVVSKSFPDFWTQWRKVGRVIEQ